MIKPLSLAFAVALAGALGALPSACSSSPSPSSAGHAPDASSPRSPDASPTPDMDPFAAQPDVSEGLVNVSADLDALLEHGALAGACDRYFAGPSTDRKAMLLCGKAQFFYEGFGTAGVPKPIIQFLLANFPDQIGPGFTKYGAILDPTSVDHLPLGLAPGAKFGTSGTIDTYAFTCASCHFARLPDGRYAVGAPNHAWEYGKENLAIALLTQLAIPGADPSKHDPAAVAAIQPLLDHMKADSSLPGKFLQVLLPLAGAGGSIPAMTTDDEHHYATWLPGTMDFFIAPLPIDDGVHTISKISALWGMVTPAEVTAGALPGEMLSWTGGTHSLEHFAHEFVALGGGDATMWPDAKLAPLVEYIRSLRAPAPLPASMPDPAQVAAGAQVFRAAGCLACHDAPRGGGRHLFDYATIGTDDAMKRWADPMLTGMLCCQIIPLPGDGITHQLKSPRLVGLWAMSRFLHNGSVASLESLLCVGPPRGAITEPAYGDAGHTYGCDLASADKTALLAYLRAH